MQLALALIHVVSVFYEAAFILFLSKGGEVSVQPLFIIPAFILKEEFR